jgi:hypothetical protein
MMTQSSLFVHKIVMEMFGLVERCGLELKNFKFLFIQADKLAASEGWGFLFGQVADHVRWH